MPWHRSRHLGERDTTRSMTFMPGRDVRFRKELPAATACFLVFLPVTAAGQGSDEAERECRGPDSAQCAGLRTVADTALHSETQARRASDQHAAAADEGSWEFEIFTRAGGAGVAAATSATLDFGGVPDQLSTYRRALQTRALAWGGGFRAMRDSWGIEVQYGRVGGSSLTEASVLRRTPEFGTGALPVPEGAADLYGALVVREFDRGTVSWFAGLGGGYAFLRTADFQEVLFPSGQPLDASVGQVIDGMPLSLEFQVTRHQTSATRRAPLATGALGATFRLGRFVVRPRLDGSIGGPWSAAANWDAAMRLETPQQTFASAGTFNLSTDVRPRFLLLSVDLGWSTRRR